MGKKNITGNEGRIRGNFDSGTFFLNSNDAYKFQVFLFFSEWQLKKSNAVFNCWPEAAQL